jgi:hypothetical protein
MAVTKLTGKASTSALYAKKEVQKKEEVQPAAPPVTTEPTRAEPMQVADGFDEAQAEPAVDLGSTPSATPLNAQAQVPPQSPTAATGDSPPPTVAAATAGATGGTSIPPATGLDPEFQIRPPESPEQAAEWLSDPNNSRYEDGIHGTQIRAQDTAWLASQDPEKLPEVFEALGPEETAQLVSDTVNGTANDNQQFFPNDAAMQSSFESIGTALGTMPEDFQTEVGTQLASGDSALASSLLLRQGGPGLDATRRGFLDAAREQVTEDPFMARAAGNVMAGSQDLVNEYAQEWGDDFISMLDKGLGELPPHNQDSYHTDFASMQNDGLEQVVGMMANYDGPDAQMTKARVFSTAAQTLDDMGNDNASLRAGMDQLFLSDSRGIAEWLGNGTRPDQAHLPAVERQSNPLLDVNGEYLSRYFRESVFENPNPNGAVVQHVNSLVDEMKDDLLRANGDERESIGHALGYMVGSAALGYAAARDANKDSREAREALLNMMFQPIQGAASGVASGAGGPVGGLVADKVTEAGMDALVGFLNNGLEEEQRDMDQLRYNILQNLYSGLPFEYQTALDSKIGRMLGVSGNSNQ